MSFVGGKRSERALMSAKCEMFRSWVDNSRYPITSLLIDGYNVMIMVLCLLSALQLLRSC